MTRSASLESEITQWLESLIRDGDLLDAVAGQEEIETAVDAIEGKSGVPAFGFDLLSRRANLRAAAVVLKNLGSLDVIAVDKSISLTSGEVLRPDILCFNPESRTFVIFGVKRDKLTERQAVTELAGYEQQLRNALPFLGDFDLNFVVIATQWDVLLSHAVANFNTWSGKNCLALKVSADERPFSLACLLPDAWQLRGSSSLSLEAMQSIDVYLYEDDDKAEDKEVADPSAPPPELITAINIIARSGDRHGSHGFAMLWSDHATLVGGHWCLTLCGVDPMSMHAWCRTNGLAIRSSPLTGYLDEHRADLMGLAPGSLLTIAKESFPVLRGKFSPMFETDCSWDQKLTLLRRRATPLYFEFWGSMGDYAREFICHAQVRERYMAHIDAHGFDWTHPSVAVPLIGNICGDIPFPDGLVRCSDAFSAGVKLGLHEVLARIAEGSEDEARKLSALLEWSMLEGARVAIEMAEIYRTVKEVDEPPPTLSNAPDKRTHSAEALCDWARDHLIGDDHLIHQHCFELGRWGAVFFTDWLDELERQAFLEAHAAAIARPLRQMLIDVLAEAEPFERMPERTQSLLSFLRAVGIHSDVELKESPSRFLSVSAPTLLRAFRDHGARGLDEIVPAILHTVGGLPEISLDWGGMKDSARQIFESGCHWPAILISQNGQHGVGMMDEPLRKILPPIQDPGVEVYFCDQKAVASMWIKITWAELQHQLTSSVSAEK